MKHYIHILKLEQNKFFIAESQYEDVYDTINSINSDWIKKYPFNYVMKENVNEYNAILWTLKYMVQFGIENVRGSSFNQLNLSNNDIINIKCLIDNNSILCKGCGKISFKVKHYYMYEYIIKDSDYVKEYDIFFKMHCHICNRYI